MRIASYIVVLFTAFLFPFPVFCIGVALYLFFFPGYELLVIGFLVDALMGTATTDVHYTLAVGGLLLLSFYLKPYVSWYTRITL